MTSDEQEPVASGRGQQALGFLAEIRAAGWRVSRAKPILLVVGLVTAVATVLVAVLFSSAGQARPVANGAAASAHASQPGASAPGAVSARSGGGAASGGRPASSKLPPPLRRRILRWEAGRGGTNLAAVERQIGTAMQTAGLGLYADMRAACVRLTSAVGAATAGPPLPDASRQQQYARTLDGISHAAGDCRGAISVRVSEESVKTHVDRSLLSQSRQELAAMSADLYRVTGDVLLLRR